MEQDNVPSNELGRVFTIKGFASHREGTVHIDDQLTLAGLLLFGREPEEFLTQSKIKIEARISDDKVVAEEIAGPLLSIPPKIKDFLNRYMTKYTTVKGMERVEIPEYPWEGVREAVINALAHREYREGMRIQIQLTPDELVIKIPGLPPSPLTLKKFQTFNTVPYSRNPLIAETFSIFNYMEERGWGLRKMRDILKEHGLPPPTFRFDSGYFVVIFHRAKSKTQLLEQLTKRQRGIVDFVRKQGSITSTECAAQLKVTDRTAQRELGKLAQLDIIEKQGSGSATRYNLKRDTRADVG